MTLPASIACGITTLIILFFVLYWAFNQGMKEHNED